MKSILVAALAFLFLAGMKAARANDSPFEKLGDAQLLDVYKRLSAEDRYVAPELNLLLAVLGNSLETIAKAGDPVAALCKTKTSLMATYRQVISTANMLNPETRGFLKGRDLNKLRDDMESLYNADCGWFGPDSDEIRTLAGDTYFDLTSLRVGAMDAQDAHFFAAAALANRSLDERPGHDRGTIETDPVRKEIADIGLKLLGAPHLTVTRIGDTKAAPTR